MAAGSWRGRELGRESLGRKKRRTRAHVLADLSVNHVERFIFRCGFSCERVQHDYGIDVLMFTYAVNGDIENGHIEIQVKATDHPKYRDAGRTVACRVKYIDLRCWAEQPFPVILVLYDAGADQGYWVYMQRELENESRRRRILADRSKSLETATFRIPRSNRLDCRAVMRFRDFRDRVLEQVKGIIRHDN
jgi:hypothetical protein